MAALEPGVRLLEKPQRRGAALALQVTRAPAIQRLKHLDREPEMMELTDDTPQEMGIAVIPVRLERVIEECAAHGVIFVAPGGRGDFLRSDGDTEQGTRASGVKA